MLCVFVIEFVLYIRNDLPNNKSRKGSFLELHLENHAYDEIARKQGQALVLSFGFFTGGEGVVASPYKSTL